jgi:diadenosine tetraphosphatase ApaH/serine/threonine PP2A family protein phosphatase
MRILILSDIHGNRVALEAVLADAGPVDEVWSLGDIVGYGPEPSWCVNRILELGPTVSLSGNHDLAATGKVDISDFNYVAQIATAWTSAQLDQDQRTYLDSLPSMLETRGVTLAHGSPRAPVWEYIDDAYTADQNFDLLATDLCFVGHTHVAAISELPDGLSPATHSRWNPDQRILLENRRLIINPGSVGQPRDGDPRASYAIYDPDEGHVTLYRTPYDVAKVQAPMREIGLPTQLADRLALGR